MGNKKLDLLTGQWIHEAPKKKRPEAAVGRAVDSFLTSIGGYVRTINSGGVKTTAGWRNSGQGSGISDRLCWLPSGKFIAVELKAPGKKRTVSEEQFNFLMHLLKLGHAACVADSVDCVKLALAQSAFERIETLTSLFRPKRARPSSDSDFPEWLK